MAEEMIESGLWESDEAEYSKADEAIAEAEDGAEDYRRSRRPRRAFQPARGVQGCEVGIALGVCNSLANRQRLRRQIAAWPVRSSLVGPRRKA